MLATPRGRERGLICLCEHVMKTVRRIQFRTVYGLATLHTHYTNKGTTTNHISPSAPQELIGSPLLKMRLVAGWPGFSALQTCKEACYPYSVSWLACPSKAQPPERTSPLRTSPAAIMMRTSPCVSQVRISREARKGSRSSRHALPSFVIGRGSDLRPSRRRSWDNV